MPFSSYANIPLTLLALGDSYTIGEGVPEADRWVAQLADLLQERGAAVASPLLVARTGWTTSELAAAIADANLSQAFDLVTLQIGVNNQYRGQSLSTYRTEFVDLLQTAIRFADHKPAQVVVLSIPDWGLTPFAEGRDRQRIAQEIDAFNEVAREECGKAGVVFIDITPLTRTHGSNTEYLAPDGLHYAGKMHLEWARRALPYVQELLQHPGL
ncbi:SGNH/GDSL hydrolase family protein [Pontibacter beigongshangensis]|uniref:SGNH/GDSL hydrolase family protein n=1 Tax=Pontibacter beigongshangensis TaxID=2574733 RepID=UPI001650907E|nr:SGNH/GDSL hydrolase family protein [Pontibacter beigongshangensis]